MKIDLIHSPIEYFNKKVEAHKPKMEFKGGDYEYWINWEKKFRAKYTELLGKWPEEIEIKPRKEFRKISAGLAEENWIYETEPDCLVRATVLMPEDKEPLGTILCCHGHAYYGRHNAIGFTTLNPVRYLRIIRHNYGFAKKLAQSGFRTVSIDFRGFNERGDGLFPYSRRRDKCNVNHLKSSLLGYNWVTLHLWDLVKTIDFIFQVYNVSQDKMGVTGISLGGTLALYLAALDQRISQAAISSALTSFKQHSYYCSNTCGSQYIPGIYEYGDFSEIAGLIAPRNVLFSNGDKDYGGFNAEIAYQQFEKIKKIFSAAEAENNCKFIAFRGKHSFDYNTISDYFIREWLDK